MKRSPLSILAVLSLLPCFGCRGEPLLPEEPVDAAEESSGGEGSSSSTTGVPPGSDEGGSTGGEGEGSEGSEDGSSGGDESTGEDDACPPAHGCFPLIPEGWEGPIALDLSEPGDEANPCAGAYPDEAFVGGETLVAADPTCDCDCTLTATCPSAATLRTSATCGGLGNAWGLDSESTNIPFINGSTGDFWWYDANPFINALPNPTAQIDEASFLDHARACAPAGSPELESCADGSGVCVPAASPEQEEGVCVWKEGEAVCDPRYPNRHVVHQSIDDSRDCSACSVEASGGTCGTLTISGSYVGSPFSMELPHEECIVPVDDPITGTVNGATYEPDDEVTGVSCTASSSDPIGEALPADSITVCCR